jgi:hypothetical protein|tara:strand:- start:6224 stop:7108 length:885 start_codon:yes stop_codon:yes gene_type:complete
MKSNLKKLFSEEIQEVITDETLTAIQEAFDSKVELSVESALIEQDNLYAVKLKTLVTTLDQDRSKKMMRVVEAVDKNNASKMVNIVKLYERANVKDANKFKKVLIESISAYLEEFLSESIDMKDLDTAVKNRTAFDVLSNLKNVLGIDVAMMNPEIKEAVKDGKSQLTTLQKENTELKTQFKALYESNQKTQVASLLEGKTSKFPEAKKNFLRKALGDKTLKFIQENYDYTARLFDKQETSKLQTLKEDAIKTRKVKPDFVPSRKVVEEKVNNTNSNELQNEYLDVLSKGKGMS